MHPLTIIRKETPQGSELSALEKRRLLTNSLVEAAELEHNVMCLYLFAAVSLKKRVSEGVSFSQLEKIRRWEASILAVARQEMEHLAIVNNLLTAIGECPNLSRSDYPFTFHDNSVKISFSMEPFSLETMLHFICYEMPSKLSPSDEKFMEEIIDGFKPGDFDGIFRLYEEIKMLFCEIPDQYLFVGPPGAQFTTDEIVPSTSILGVNLRGVPKYDISISAVTDQRSAMKSIQQIIDEGEGSEGSNTITHFLQFLQIYKELQQELDEHPGFSPARPVVSNPKTQSKLNHTDNVSEYVHLITNAATNQVAELFDLVYENQILFLMRYFMHTDETESELNALQYAVFFPMMTALVRPLAEILTELPAYSDTGIQKTAGPPFTLTRRLKSLPHKKAAWKVLQMQLRLMAEMSENLCHSNQYTGEIKKRLQLIHENILRTRITFEQKLNSLTDHG